MTDLYTKCVLTVIAIALTLIAINMTFKPNSASAFLGGPTLGDWVTAARDGNPSTNPRDIVMKAPLVAACDGLRCYGWSKLYKIDE